MTDRPGLRITFIGLGIMGRNMAANLVRAGFDVTVWNRTPGRSSLVAELGARVAMNLAAACDQADVICACVTNSADVLELVTRPDGVAAHARAGSIFLDHSTIAPQTARQVAALLAARGVACLDAPVTGGESGARDGTLTIMCGGAAEDVERVRPVLGAMGRQIYHLGPHGAGQTMKLIGNQISGVILAATIEGVVLGRKAGLDLPLMLEVLANSSANSAALQGSRQRLLDGNQVPGFSVANRTKDLDLVLDAARMLQSPLPLTAATRELFAAVARATPDLDQIAYVNLIESLAGATAVPARGNDYLPQ